MGFSFHPLQIRDVVLVRPERHLDDRGYFKEIFQTEAFTAAGIDAPFVQDNLTRSMRGVLRGLHYQLPPQAQEKLITVVSGAIYDVAVDLRIGGGPTGVGSGRPSTSIPETCSGSHPASLTDTVSCPRQPMCCTR
jgi:dTDP-4-dehydrorhamnose 3,5-epimerase